MCEREVFVSCMAGINNMVHDWVCLCDYNLFMQDIVCVDLDIFSRENIER